jgi:hypothetical protein
MRDVAVKNQLLFNKDVKLISIGEVDDFYTSI